MRSRVATVSILFFALSIVYSCSSKNVRIDQIPQLKTGSPLAGIQPLTFAINEFEDVRPHKKFIGDAYGTHKIELDVQKASEIISQAFANELKRNGHKVMGFKESGKADVIIEGIVRQYWAAGRDYFTGSKVTADVEVEINVTAKGLEKPFTKTYHGNYFNNPAFGINLLNMGAIFTDAVNNALLNMLKEFTDDEEFLNLIKQVKRQGS